MEDEKKVSREYDMVVLSTGVQALKDADRISKTFGIDLNEYHFCETSTFRPVESNREGIYVAGPFTEPKDIPETVMQASGAASKVLSLLKDVRGSLIVQKGISSGKRCHGGGSENRGLCLPLRVEHRRICQCSGCG